MVAGGMESMSNVPFMVSRDAPAYGGHKMEVGTEWSMKIISRCCIVLQIGIVPQNSENKPRGLYFSKALFGGLIFGGAYLRRDIK